MPKARKRRKKSADPASKPAPGHELVTVKELAHRTGMSEPSIRGKIAAGLWREGEHYYRKRRRLMMDVLACDQYWVETRR